MTIKVSVEEKMANVQKDLDEALPLVEKAQAALQGLNVKEIQTMKAFKTPPKDIELVFFCVLNLLAVIDPIVPVDKNGKLKAENVWKSSLNLMQNPGALISTLEGYKEKIDEDKVPASNFKGIRSTTSQPDFNPEAILKKSSAAAGICDWVLNITAYYDVVISVEPKKKQVRESQQQLEDANEKKSEVDALVKDLSDKLAILEAEFKQAMDEKEAAEEAANRCARRMDLA